MSDWELLAILIFMESSLKLIFHRRLIFVYKPNNGSEHTLLRSETANEKLKREAQTQDSDGMLAISVLYMTQLEVTSQQ